MPAWFVACHGVQPPASGFGRQIPTCRITGRTQVYFYVREGEQLSMNGGWKLWNVLMYGERGGANAAKRAAIYVKDRHQDCIDYRYGMNADETWDDTQQGHHAIDTVGIFAVGD